MDSTLLKFVQDLAENGLKINQQQTITESTVFFNDYLRRVDEDIRQRAKDCLQNANVGRLQNEMIINILKTMNLLIDKVKEIETKLEVREKNGHA